MPKNSSNKKSQRHAGSFQKDMLCICPEALGLTLIKQTDAYSLSLIYTNLNCQLRGVSH